jgi:hypothetical protein
MEENMPKPQSNKSTIKNDPWASVIPMPVELELPELAAIEVGKPETNPPKPARKARAVNADRPRREAPVIQTELAGRRKLTVNLDAALAERVKNAAYWNPRLTIAAIAEEGIRHAIEKFEREHGGKYPPREGYLIGGQQIK